MELSFHVPGKPRPKGSMKAVGRYGRGGMKEDNDESVPWRVSVAWAARHAMRAHEAATGERWARLEGPIELDVVFAFDKPKGAPKTKEIFPVTRSTYDIDKLLRNISDALTDAGAWRDDSQVTRITGTKTYCTDPQPTQGAQVIVRSLEVRKDAMC